MIHSCVIIGHFNPVLLAVYMFNLIIADDHSIVRDGIRPLFEARNDVNIVAETNDGLATISAIRRMQPDVVLLDVSMPYVSAMEICVETKRWSPKTHLLAFTGINSGSMLQELIDEGVRGIVLKSDDVQKLGVAFNEITAGRSYISDAAQSQLDSVKQVTNLTSRERQILKMIVSGNTTTEIGKLLSVSPKTIENHRTNLMKKLDVHSISELMALAYREGLVPSANDPQ